MTDDPFFLAYNNDEVAFGSRPSLELASYLSQVRPTGFAVDLGAGAGRNAISLAQAGLHVRAIDLSRRGLDRLMERARVLGVVDRIETEVADVRKVELLPDSLSVVVATTVLDHIPFADAQAVWLRIVTSLTASGVIYAEVHTTEDPGCSEKPGCDSVHPVSETAWAVKHYFRPSELLKLAALTPSIRVLRYEERLEWDYTHGPEHHHGKAILLAVRTEFFPPWYGHPIAFPRKH